MRVKITLACTECKQRNYNTMKNKKNSPDRLEMNKYCRFCRKRFHPVIVLITGEWQFQIGAFQLFLYAAAHDIPGDTCIIDWQCRSQQKEDGERNRYPTDAPGFSEDESDTNNVAPDVESYKVKAIDGNAVIVEAAYNADCHQYQHRQYQSG